VREKGAYKELDLAVYGAKCAGCISKIEGALQELTGIETARLNLSTGKLHVAWQGSLLPQAITETVRSLGYRATPYDPEASEKQNDAYGRLLIRCLAVAGFATANVMLLSIGVWASAGDEMGESTRALMHFVSALIAIPAGLYAGRPFFSSALQALRAGSANMDVPISLAVMLALGFSLFETFHGGEEAYFDAAVMLLFFLLTGRWLDHTLRNRARAAARDLLALQAVTANYLQPDGTIRAVAAKEIKPDDRLMIFPGDRIPVNGEILEGTSEVDTALVTGESAPTLHQQGDKVVAGLLNLTNTLTIRATATVDDSLIADLTRMVEAGQQVKSRFVRLADRAARAYVPIVHTLALATFLGWLVIGEASIRVALMNAIALLIITCPCALGLATPAVQVVATGRLFKEGILVKTGDALERLSQVTRFVFDKTGTLTTGQLRLENREALSDEDYNAAVALARTSHHPIARAIVEEAGSGTVATDIVETPGQGISGVVDGQDIRIGHAAYAGAAEADITNADPISWLRIGDMPPQKMQFKDHLREKTHETVTQLQQAGFPVMMLSGDRPEPAQRVAEMAGIQDWQASLTPVGKIDILQSLADAGEKVAMVGDGLNDTPALATAHVSLSPGSAAEAAQSAADFVFQGNSLSSVHTAWQVACRSQQHIRQNFAFAVMYNMVAAPLAMAGFVTPLIAALAMSGSSLIVTLNAMRLNRFKGETA
jgi:Cu2+-exporting ATPase